VGFRLDGLERIGEFALAAGSDPAQVGFAPDGGSLVVTDRGTDAIVQFPVDDAGLLGDGRASPSAGPTPYGFVFAGDTLVVTEAFGAAKGKAAASSYRFDAGEATPVSRSIGNGRSEICWAVATADGRYAFTTNFDDGFGGSPAVEDEAAWFDRFDHVAQNVHDVLGLDSSERPGEHGEVERVRCELDRLARGDAVEDALGKLSGRRAPRPLHRFGVRIEREHRCGVSRDRDRESPSPQPSSRIRCLRKSPRR
jgi:hypothetical protein